jgi:hypothetical protein
VILQQLFQSGVIQADQIVFVMSATNASANKRAQSGVQLANGFADVLESVDEVRLLNLIIWFA